MARLITLTLQATDEEIQNLLGNFAARAEFTGFDGDSEDAADDTAPTGERDKNDVPWLESVHASTKTMTKDGTWRGKKGVSPEQRAAAEKAWKDSNSGGSFVVPQSISGVAGGVTLPLGNPPAPVGMPGMPGMVAQEPPKPVSYQEVADRYTTLAGAGKIDANGMMTLYQKLGITDPGVLTTDETLRRNIMKELDALG